MTSDTIALMLIGAVMAFWMKPDEGLDPPVPDVKRPLVSETAA